MGNQTNLNIKIDGKPIDKTNVMSVVVERDMFQPDMAAVVLSNQGCVYSKEVKVSKTIEISAGDDDGKPIYKGEVVGLEPIWRGAEKTRVLIRGMNKLHRLLRKRKSLTFTDKSDQQIINQVAGDAGLTLEWKHDKSITYKHVYQHNLTDLEFIRLRAARMGCHVWCVDSKLYVKQPDLQAKERAKLHVGKAVSEVGPDALKSFTPRLSSAAIVNKVTVKGWNPEKKELITGVASAAGSKLGDKNAVSGSGDMGTEETFTVDHPIWSNDEATALAKARLQDLSLSYITGECELPGNPEWDLGDIADITCNQDDQNDPFNGRYYVMGLTHRYTVPRNQEGGFLTFLKLARDAQKS